MHRTISRIAGFIAIASIPLAITLASTAVAAGLISGASIKAHTVTAKQIKARSLTPSLFKSGHFPTGPRGARGRSGPAGPGGSARAYGTVTPDGMLVPGAKNLTVQPIETGRWCIRPTSGSGIDPSRSSPAMTLAYLPGYAEVANGPTSVTPAVLIGFKQECAGGWIASISELSFANGGQGAPQLALQNEAFTFMVP